MQPLPEAKKDEGKGFSFYMPFMRAFGLGAPKGMSPITEKKWGSSMEKNNTKKSTNMYLSNTFMRAFGLGAPKGMSPKLCFETKMTKVSSKNLLMKNYKNNFISLPIFYLIMCLM